MKGLADAISVGAAAAENNIPIILANEKSELQGADEFLNSLNIEKSYIIGGTASLSNNLESKLKIQLDYLVVVETKLIQR